MEQSESSKAICGLLTEVTAMRSRIETRGDYLYSTFKLHLQRDSYRESARNLAHYLALRQQNLHILQFELMRLGFASLGRIEGNVLGTLTAIERVLETLCHGIPFDDQIAQSVRNDPIPAPLRVATETLFGPHHDDRNVRIMVTLPTEAATNPVMIGELMDRGMNCVRINCAHDDADVWQQMITHTRREAASRNRVCPIYMDLAGPKIRTEAIGFKKKHLFHVGDELLLTRHEPQRNKKKRPGPYQVQCGAPQVLEQVAEGETVWFDDGKIGTRVTAVLPEGLLLKIEQASAEGNRVRLRKGINFPDTKLVLSPLTAKDRDDLDFIAQHADMIGYSFVQTPDDIALLQDEIENRLDDSDALQKLAIIAKIETRQAVANLPGLIVKGAGTQPFGVMLARGDLAVEIGFERLAEMQEEILWICEAAHVPVIWATQVLESITKRDVISRAEITDAAHGIRAECVMLNKGDYVGEAVTTLSNVLQRMAGHKYKRFNVLRALHSWEHYVGN
jgi:pyruvate kinase